MTVSSLTVLLVLGAVICALQAIRGARLLNSAIWLAGASATTSLLLYQLGAPQAAVIELSVGAGLVFILFVFAINLAPGDAPNDASQVPALVAVTLAGLVLLLLGELVWPRLAAPILAAPAAAGAALSSVLWQDRQLDVVVQIVLIFAGALTVVGLLATETNTGTAEPGREQTSLERLAPRPTPITPAQLRPERQPVSPAVLAPLPRGPVSRAEQAAQKEKVA